MAVKRFYARQNTRVSNSYDKRWQYWEIQAIIGMIPKNSFTKTVGCAIL